MTRLKGAVIGCGFFAQNHLHGWLDIDEVEIVAVCDRDREKAAAAARTFGIAAVHSDPAEMFAAHALDFVDIPTTMETHEELVLLAVRHGVPAIVQKPFGPDIAACRRMVAAAADAGVPLMVHENFRFQPAFRAIKAVLDEGSLGPLTFGRLSWRTGLDVYANQPYLATVERFIILDLGIHVLDLARFIFGEAHSVFCRTQRIKPGIAGEDMATILLGHESGATSIVDFSYASRRDPETFPQTLVEIEGRNGSLILERDHRLTIHAGGKTRHEHLAPVPRSWTQAPWDLIQDSVVHTQRHFILSLMGDRDPETSGLDNLATFALVEAAYESATKRMPVVPILR